MTSYRISKYDPANRDSMGSYLDDSEWTAISHVGQEAYRQVTYQEYKLVEDAYVDAIKVILAEKGIDFLKITSIESYNDKADFLEYHTKGILNEVDVSYEEVQSLRNGIRLSLGMLPKVIRLLMREIVWMCLVNDKVKIYTGYDYYLYARCGKLKPASIERIERSGLFVEKIS